MKQNRKRPDPLYWSGSGRFIVGAAVLILLFLRLQPGERSQQGS
jgi:hypothetical protein